MGDLVLDSSAHIYRLNGQRIPGATEVLRAMGVIDDQWYTDYGRQRGDALHRACQLLDEGDLDQDSVDPAIAGRLAAYQRFLVEHHCLWWMIERPICNEVYRVACTPDRVGVVAGMPAIVDLKAGDVPAWVALQTACQELCLPSPLLIRQGSITEPMLPKPGQVMAVTPEAVKTIRWRRFALQLKDDGRYSLHPFTNPQDKDVFLSALACLNWRTLHGYLART